MSRNKMRKPPMESGGKYQRLKRPAGQGPVTSVKSVSGGTAMADAAIAKTKEVLKSPAMPLPEKAKKY